MLTAGVARALHVWEDPNAWSTGFTTYKIPADKPVFAGDELSLDLSGSYIAPQRGLQHVFETNIRHTGKWGGNVGLNYFPDQYIGIGGNINMSDNGGAFVDQALGNLIVRFPICPIALAPYVFGGGGRSFDNLVEFEPKWQWFADFGVGLEFRPSPVMGIFSDAAYMWHLDDGGVDRLLIRVGLRLLF